MKHPGAALCWTIAPRRPRTSLEKENNTTHATRELRHDLALSHSTTSGATWVSRLFVQYTYVGAAPTTRLHLDSRYRSLGKRPVEPKLFLSRSRTPTQVSQTRAPQRLQSKPQVRMSPRIVSLLFLRYHLRYLLNPLSTVIPPTLVPPLALPTVTTRPHLTQPTPVIAPPPAILPPAVLPPATIRPQLIPQGIPPNTIAKAPRRVQRVDSHPEPQSLEEQDRQQITVLAKGNGWRLFRRQGKICARGHTTQRLNATGDEYVNRKFDAAGETKITLNGHLLGHRQYKCQAFQLPNRGEKLFMLAYQCARALNITNANYLFKNNNDLYRITLTEEEQADLVERAILPPFYLGIRAAAVTARSVFRQFGRRIIFEGQLVRDDYWEEFAKRSEEDAMEPEPPSLLANIDPALLMASPKVLADACSQYRNPPPLVRRKRHRNSNYGKKRYVKPSRLSTPDPPTPTSVPTAEMSDSQNNDDDSTQNDHAARDHEAQDGNRNDNIDFGELMPLYEFLHPESQP